MAFDNPMVFFLVCIAFVSGIGITPQSCGRAIFTSPSGTISSPNYPKNYSNNEDCAYSIWAPEVSSFTLSFEAFRLEFKSDCGYDWVQIKCDNSSRISPKYCGSTLPKPTYISNCSKVLIWFHTDISVVDSGFSLQYSFASDDTTSASESCQDQSASDAVIALAVLLALSVLGNIGTAIHFELRRRREASREEGDPSSDSRKTQATGSVHVNPPIYVVSPESSTTWKTDDCSYERLKNEFHNPAAYETLKSKNVSIWGDLHWIWLYYSTVLGLHNRHPLGRRFESVDYH